MYYTRLRDSIINICTTDVEERYGQKCFQVVTMMWHVDLRTVLWLRAGLAFDRLMAELLCHSSFLSCKDNTLNVLIHKLQC